MAIRTRKRGKTWYFLFDAKTLDGKRKIIEKGGFSTKKEAVEAGTLAFADYKRGNIGIVSDKVTLDAFLASWLIVKEKEVRPKTFSNYKARIKRLSPLVGAVTLQELRPRHIEAAMQTLAADGFSHNSLVAALVLLRTALDYAVYPCELIQSNPARYIKVPASAPRKVIERQVIGKDKMQELLEVYPYGHPAHLPIVIAYHTGMRLGEVLGLCWDSVDLKQRKISVVRQECYTGEKGAYFGEPKTETSKREILIDSHLISLLHRWRNDQKKQELEKGAGYLLAYEDKEGRIWHYNKAGAPSDFIRRHPVCTREDGSMLTPRAMNRYMALLGVNFHSLRHTHATMLIEAGAIPKDVAARLGHADATITQNLYTHNTEEMQKSTLAIFEKMMAK